MKLSKKPPERMRRGLSREETLPNNGSAVIASAGMTRRWQTDLGSKLRIGFDTCICAVEAKKLVFFADADTDR